MGISRRFLVVAAVGVVVGGGVGLGLGLAQDDDEPISTSASTTAPPSGPGMDSTRLRGLALPTGTCDWVVEELEANTGQPLPKPLQLHDGAVPTTDAYNGGITLEDQPLFRDLDGDRRDDAVVGIRCSNGGSGHTIEIHAFGADGGSLGHFEVGEALELGTRPEPELTLEGRQLTLVYNAIGEFDSYCCGTERVTDRYDWSVGGWKRSSRAIVTAASVANEVLAAAETGDRPTLDRLATADVRDLLLQLAAEGPLGECSQASSFGDALEGRACLFSVGPIAYELRMSPGAGLGDWMATEVIGIGGGM